MYIYTQTHILFVLAPARMYCTTHIFYFGVTVFVQYYSDLDSYMDSKFTFDLGPNNPATSVLFGPKFLSSLLYQLSPAEVLINN